MKIQMMMNKVFPSQTINKNSSRSCKYDIHDWQKDLHAKSLKVEFSRVDSTAALCFISERQVPASKTTKFAGDTAGHHYNNNVIL